MKIKHVAIIMDGNGRWAKQRGRSRIEGHREGVKRVDEIIKTALDLKLNALTLYAFSMENWQRPKKEINSLMGILEHYLKREMKRIARNNIVFRAIGNLERLPENIQEILAQFEHITRKNNGLFLTSALSYGSKEEIITAVKCIIRDGLTPEEVGKKTFERYLFTSGLPDPDLIIRTSGEMRLSNFLLWQAAYAELYFTETLWPDFGREEFISAVKEYRKRERRFGALPESRSVLLNHCGR
jgi:undecaprenyl diphosphate synthase